MAVAKNFLIFLVSSLLLFTAIVPVVRAEEASPSAQPQEEISIPEPSVAPIVILPQQASDPVCIVSSSNCYATIQAAVDAAVNGDTINVGAGTYNETVTVNKSLTFNGSGSVTIVTMVITASPVSINGITVTNLTYPDTQAPVISGVTLANLTTGNNAYLKNGDSVRLTSKVTDNTQSTITTSMITANLSALGGGASVNPSNYDSATAVATWNAITVSGTTSGSVNVTVNASDAASNNATQQSVSIIADNLPPGQATNLALTNPVNNANKTNVSITGNGEVGATVAYTISNGASSISGASTVSNSGTISITGIDASTLLDGTLTLSLTLTDLAGNIATASLATSTKDTVAPNVSAGSNVFKGSGFTTSASVEDPLPSPGIASYTWTKVSGPGVVTFGTSSTLNTTVSVDTDGNYVIRLTVQDLAGNSAFGEFSLTWDSVKPAVFVGGDVTTKETFTKTATVNDPDPSSQIASKTWSKISGPGSITFSAPNALTTDISADTDGTYVIGLTSLDNAGNSTTSTFTLIWDTVNPTDPGIPATETPTRLTSQIWNFVASTDVTSGIAQYIWRTMLGIVDGPSGTALGDVTTITTDLTEGVWTFFIKALDNAGNQSNEVSNTVMVDTANPVTTDSGTDNLWHKNPVTVTLSCTDNLSGCVQIVYTTDGSDPVTSATRVVVNSDTAVINLSAEGVYTIQYYSLDNAGNQENTKTAANQVKIDTTLPTTAADNVIAGWFISNPNITLSVSDLGGSLLNNVRYNWDSPALLTVGTVFTDGAIINIPSDGVHSLYLYVDDNAANSQTFSAVYMFDTVDPVVSATGSSSDWQASVPSIVVTGSDTLPGSDVLEVKYGWDQEATIDVASGTDLTSTFPSDGTHTLNLLITDVSGRTAVFSGTYKIDRDAPLTSDNTDDLWHSSSVTITLTCDDNNLSGCSQTYYTQDGSDPTISSSLGTSIVLNSSGVYTIKYFSIDNAGNAETVKTASNQVKIDLIFPVISNVTLTNVTTGNNIYIKDGDTINITAIVTDNNLLLLTTSMITADLSTIGGGSAVNPISYDNLTGLATWANILVSGSGNGVVTITVNTSDVASNPALAQLVTSIADNTVPLILQTTVSSNNPNPSFAKANDVITLAFTASETIQTPAVTIAGNPVTMTNTSGNIWSGTYTMVVTDSEGSILYTISFADPAGNAGSAISTSSGITFDQTPATGSWVNPQPSSTVSGIVNLTVSVSDNLSQVASVTFQYKRNDGVDTFHDITITWDTTALALDFYTLRTVVVDGAGNFVNIDQIVEVATIITPETTPPVPSTNSITITWTTGDPATSRVIYDTTSHPVLGAAPNYGYANSSDETDLSKITSHSVTLSGLTPATTYYYRMVSRGSPEAVSGELSFTTKIVAVGATGGGNGGGGGGGAPSCNDAKPESAPKLISALANSLNQIILTWSKAKGPVSYYLVTYGLSPGKQQFGNPNVGGTDTTSYTVSGLQSGKTYYFRVRAGNGCMSGDFSNELSAKVKGKVLTEAPAAGFEPGVLGEKTSLEVSPPAVSPSTTPSVSESPQPSTAPFTPQAPKKALPFALVIAIIVGGVLFLISRI